jgi:drug/metabolite transporter (DMT)-like permease
MDRTARYPSRPMGRTPVLATARGTRPEAFGPVEWGLLAAVASMWGSSFVFIAIGLEAFGPGLVSLLRLALGAAALSLAPAVRRPVPREDWPRIVVLALVWMAIPLLLFPVAQDLGVASSVAGMLNGGMPLFAALFAWFLLRRPPEARQALGLIVGFGGVVLVTLPEVQGATSTAIGAALVLVATALYGLAANVAVPLQQRHGALPVVFRAQLVALVGVLPFGVAAVPGSQFAWPSLLAMLALGIFGTGLAFIAMATLVGRAGATRGAVAIYFIPVVAMILGVTVRGETIEPVSLVGLGLILVGALLTSRREASRA